MILTQRKTISFSGAKAWRACQSIGRFCLSVLRREPEREIHFRFSNHLLFHPALNDHINKNEWDNRRQMYG